MAITQELPWTYSTRASESEVSIRQLNQEPEKGKKRIHKIVLDLFNFFMFLYDPGSTGQWSEEKIGGTSKRTPMESICCSGEIHHSGQSWFSWTHFPCFFSSICFLFSESNNLNDYLIIKFLLHSFPLPLSNLCQHSPTSTLLSTIRTLALANCRVTHIFPLPLTQLTWGSHISFLPLP